MRSTEEILARIAEHRASDRIFDFRAETLAEALPSSALDTAGFCTTTPEEWDEARLDTDDKIRVAAIEYLTFAFDKAKDHRGLSANRSVDRMGEYLWLLGLDTTKFHAADYAQYGVPKLAAAAEALGVTFPDDPQLKNMAEGRQCLHGTDPADRSWDHGICQEGCGA